MFAIGKTHRKRDEFPGAGQSDWRESLPPAEERGTHVSVPLKSVGAITLFVDDPKRSKAFYEKVFDATDIYEDENSAAFRFENTIVNLLARREASGLIGPAAVAEPGAGSQLQLTIWVDDADAACEELAARGVTLLNGPINRAWGMRTAAFADPDGHVWEVAQELPKG
jgi:catechol 2,3-dioxygenase-like lactoylglutathione lyase family enzyme